MAKKLAGWLLPRVAVNVPISKQRPRMSGVSPGAILRPVINSAIIHRVRSNAPSQSAFLT